LFFLFSGEIGGGIVVHLAVHLEYGQRVYFTAANVQQVALNLQRGVGNG
jgi:hypothetical protein